MNARFVSCSSLVVVSLLTSPWSLTAGENASSVRVKKSAKETAAQSKKKAARLAAAAAEAELLQTRLSWWNGTMSLSRNHVGRRVGKAIETARISTGDTSAPSTEANAVDPQPNAVGGTRQIDGTYAITASDAYRYVQVGVTQNSVINHTAGVFSVGDATAGAGELDLGYTTGKTGTYNLSNSASLNIVGDLYVGYSAGGAFVQNGGSVTVASDGITLGSTDGAVCTYLINSGSVNTQFLTIGDLSTGTFTQNGGTVSVGASPVAGSNTFQRFAFGGKTGDTYNLNGGTLSIPNVYIYTDSPAVLNSATFNFNGGILQALPQSGTAATFLPTGLAAANVQVGGAKIDTNGLNITIAQGLVHDTTSGAPALDGGLTKQTGTGTLTLTGTNTYTGPTAVNAGFLKIDNNPSGTPVTSGQLTATNGITIGNGGTLLLSGSATVTDRLNNAAPMTINGGGTFSTGGLNEGARPTAAGGAGGAVGLGALTLSATTSTVRATIDFGVTGTGSALVFSSLAASGKGAFVTILDFTGAARTDTGLATNDRLLFTTDPGFTTADLANWQFTNDNNVAFATGGLEIPYNGYFEIVPVPEPATWAGGSLTVLALAAGLRRGRRMEVNTKS